MTTPNSKSPYQPLADYAVASSCAIVLAYEKKFGQKKPDSDEEADALDIFKWYRSLSDEEKGEIHEQAVQGLKEFRGYQPEDIDDSLISHVGYSPAECGYGEDGK